MSDASRTRQYELGEGACVSASSYVDDVNKDPVVILDGLTKGFRFVPSSTASTHWHSTDIVSRQVCLDGDVVGLSVLSSSSVHLVKLGLTLMAAVRFFLLLSIDTVSLTGSGRSIARHSNGSYTSPRILPRQA
jgi:hypothetical protein